MEISAGIYGVGLLSEHLPLCVWRVGLAERRMPLALRTADDGCGDVASPSGEQAGFLSLLRQMGNLYRHAEDIFAQLNLDVQQLSTRSDQLHSRLACLQAVSERLPNPKTLKIATGGDFSRFTNVGVHYSSFKESDCQTNMFTAKTRPAHLRLAYSSAGRKGKELVTDSAATQTDTPAAIPSPNAWTPSGSPALSDKRRDSVAFDSPKHLPTPEQRSSTLATECRASLVPVDISGSSLKRNKTCRKSYLHEDRIEPEKWKEEVGRRRNRRKTIAISSPADSAFDRSWKPRTPSPLQTSAVELDPLYSSYAMSECPYDDLPFRKRTKTSALFNTANIFASLRRLSRKKKTSSEYSAITSLRKLDKENGTGSKEATKSPKPSLKNFLRRSVSLRIKDRKGGECDVYEQLPHQRRMPPAEDRAGGDVPRQRVCRHDSLRKKLSLPISTTSQVIHLATSLRNEPHKPVPSVSSPSTSHPRPVSFISSNSLDLDENETGNGWYRRGYQLDFPEECSSSAPTSESNHAEHHSACDSALEFSGQSSPRDPMESGMGSAGDDSSHSCDQEGYYTSMHRDSGILAWRKEKDGKVESETTGQSRGSSDSGAEDLQSPPRRPGHQEAALRRDGYRATLPLHQSPKYRLPDSHCLDEWLLQKFRLELAMRNEDVRIRKDAVKPWEYGFEDERAWSLPRPRKTAPQTANGTLSRKIVRFCD